VNLSNLTIRAKLAMGFGVLATIVVVVAGMSLRALSESTEGFSGFVHGINARATLANGVRTAVDRRAIAARNLVLVVKPEDLALEKAEVLQAHEDVQSRLKQLKEAIANAQDTTAQARALIDDIDRVEARYGPVATDIVQLALGGKREAAIQKMDDECRPLLAQLVKATKAYATYTAESEERRVQAYEQNYKNQRNLLIGISLGAALIAVGAGLLITRSITQPISKAVDVAQTVARGDLGSRIEVRGKDETSHLLSPCAT
jgi:methyl-accepting chemotaxis protein-1 (serine sensor receptor)